MKYLTLAYGLFAFLLVLTDVHGAPHSGSRFVYSQPDGTDVEVRVWGDEYYQRVESVDGYTLIRESKTSWIVFAKLSKNGKSFRSTGVKYTGSGSSVAVQKLGVPKHIKLPKETVRDQARKNQQRWGSAVNAEDKLKGELVGNLQGLTLLVDFSDEPATIPQTDLNGLMNADNYTGYGNMGSVKAYYYDVSAGALTYTNYVGQYYRAQNPKTYYDNKDSGKPEAQELLREALDDLEAQGFDYSSLSINDDDQILATNLLYAGFPTQGWSIGLWPHSNAYDDFSADGVSSHKYQITNIGDDISIRTICHENGHMIGFFPDLYDYGYESAGVGAFCLMASGGPNKAPVPINAHYRTLAGWENVTDITGAANGTVFSSISNSNNSFVYIDQSNSDEFFVIESRYPEGRDAALPGHGLLIWHVDMDGDNDNEQMTNGEHYYVSIEQADNLFDLENGIGYGDTLDPFFEGHNDSFSDSTSPDANWWNGDNSGLDMGNISGVGATQMFTIGQTLPETYTVSGNVVGAGQAPTTVNFGGFFVGSVEANSGGTFAIADLVPGTYQIQAKAHTYYSDTVEVTVGPDQNVDLNVSIPEMTIKPESLNITVTQDEPVGTANVVISNTSDVVLNHEMFVTNKVDVVINEVYTGGSVPPDGVELWNKGDDVDLLGWKLVFKDNAWTSGTYTFDEEFILESGSTLLVNDEYGGSVEENEIYIGFDLNWYYAEDTELSVALVDSWGYGVDFFKSLGSADEPPVGTSWVGDGLAVTTMTSRRVSNDDNDNVSDWESGVSASMNNLNPNQKNIPLEESTWLSASIEGDTTPPASSTTITVTVDGTGLNPGETVTDSIFIYHDSFSPEGTREVLVEMVMYNDTPGDTDTDDDTDTDTDTLPNAQGGGSDDGCGCNAAGQVRNSFASLILLLTALLG